MMTWLSNREDIPEVLAMVDMLRHFKLETGPEMRTKCIDFWNSVHNVTD